MSSLVFITIFVFVIICISFIILLTTFIITLARKFQTKHKDYEKNTEELNQKHEATILQTYTTVQEQTFEDIARELHDNIGQKLSLAKFSLNAIDVIDVAKTSQQIEDLKSIVNESMLDLSNLNKSISNQILHANGFIYAIERELELMKKTGNFETILEVKGHSSFLSQASELMIFRVLQELFNNIMKHSNARKLQLKFFYENNHCNIILSDDGLGIDTSKICSNGLGLQNIKQRLAMLKADYNCNPIPGKGTTIHIKIPVDDCN